MMKHRVDKLKRIRKKKKSRLLTILLTGFLICAVGLIINSIINNANEIHAPDWVDAQIIRLDGASRNGEELEGINDIVIHYVGNPNTTAQQNRNYYNNTDSEVSSHFIVGLDGEAIQCVPLNEKSAASNWRNSDTISIEVCHPDDTGVFTKESYDSLIRLTAWLCDTFELDETHVIRHYDVTGKECPRYFVDNEDKWEDFKADVEEYRARA